MVLADVEMKNRLERRVRVLTLRSGAESVSQLVSLLSLKNSLPRERERDENHVLEGFDSEDEWMHKRWKLLRE